MTKFSSRIHLYIAVVCLVLAIGAAIGTIGHFIWGGFFNYGVDYASSHSVSVSYYVTDYTSGQVQEICENNLGGLGGYTLTKSDSNGKMEFTFSADSDGDAIKQAVEKINAELDTKTGINVATYHEAEGLVTNVGTYIWCAVAVASIIAVQAVYIAVRYKIGMAAVSLISNVAGAAMFVSLLAAVRLPLGSYVAPVAFVCVLLTMICSQYFFAKARACFKEDGMSAVPSLEQTDCAASRSWRRILLICGIVFGASVLTAVALAVAAPTIAFASPAVAAAVAAAVSFFTSAMFTPAIYSRFKLVSDKRKAAKAN